MAWAPHTPQRKSCGVCCLKMSPRVDAQLFFFLIFWAGLICILLAVSHLFCLVQRSQTRDFSGRIPIFSHWGWRAPKWAWSHSSHSSSMTCSASAYGRCSTVPGDSSQGWPWQCLTSRTAMAPEAEPKKHHATATANGMTQWPEKVPGNHAIHCYTGSRLYHACSTVVSGISHGFPVDFPVDFPLWPKRPSVVRPSLSPPQWYPSLRWAASPRAMNPTYPKIGMKPAKLLMFLQCPSALDRYDYHIVSRFGWALGFEYGIVEIDQHPYRGAGSFLTLKMLPPSCFLWRWEATSR